MKIGKAFLIAGSVAVGSMAMGQGAEASWHVPKAISGGLSSLAHAGANYACTHSCASGSGVLLCFAGDSNALANLTQKLTTDEETCVKTYCGNSEASKHVGTTTSGKKSPASTALALAKAKICAHYSPDSKASSSGHTKHHKRKKSH